MRGRRIQARLQPFETAFAAIVISQSVVALFGNSLLDPAAALLPMWQALVFEITYMLAGLLILAGLLWPRGDVEGAGLVLLGSTLTVRGFLYGYYLHWEPPSFTSLTFSLFLAMACVLRFYFLRSNASQWIVNGGDVVVDDAGNAQIVVNGADDENGENGEHEDQ